MSNNRNMFEDEYFSIDCISVVGIDYVESMLQEELFLFILNQLRQADGCVNSLSKKNTKRLLLRLLAEY